MGLAKFNKSSTKGTALASTDGEKIFFPTDFRGIIFNQKEVAIGAIDVTRLMAANGTLNVTLEELSKCALYVHPTESGYAKATFFPHHDGVSGLQFSPSSGYLVVESIKDKGSTVVRRCFFATVTETSGVVKTTAFEYRDINF